MSDLVLCLFLLVLTVAAAKAVAALIDWLT